MKNLQEDIDSLKRLELKAKEIVKGFLIGQHKSPMHGYSVEFAEHKMYNPGESTRHIDWKLYARTEKLYQKKYEEETNLRCQIVIDTSSSMLYPLQSPINKLTFSIYSAAALTQLMLQQRDGIGLTLCSDKIETHLSARLSTQHIQHLYSILSELLQTNKKNDLKQTDISSALHQIAEVVHQRSLIILFSDIFERSHDIFNALQHLRYRKHDVIVFHTLDYNTEVEFDFDNRPYQFIDMETGEQVKINSVEFKDLYTQQIKIFLNNLKEKCHQYKIDFVPVDIKNAYYEVLQEYLIKRSKIIKK
ncbi:MAG: hypothetical protein KatS3mg027_1130 [Bacteroidia bacterium]|nr:MAG: hypothetical protein KatS3mg027_1130 [Bacteroidia bacterium]